MRLRLVGNIPRTFGRCGRCADFLEGELNCTLELSVEEVASVAIPGAVHAHGMTMAFVAV